MTRSSLRALRLATAAATIGGICAVSAAPALADSGISYFNGSATGQAVSLTVSPSSVLNVNLAGIQSQLNSLPLGAGQTINNVAGSTLQNPTAPITVQIDASHAQGVAQKGVQLSDGSASSTAVSIDAASLKSEVTLLNAMLQNMPQGTVTALDNALSPITSNDPTGAVKQALSSVEQQLQTPTTLLGSPSANVLQSVSARFGEDKKANIVTVQQGGLLTPTDSYRLDPFEARALPSDAYANNAVESLNVLPSTLGKLGVPALSLPTLDASLANLQTALTNAETKLTTTASSVPLVGSQAGSALNGVTSTINPTVTNVVSVTTSTGVTQKVDLNQVNALINQVVALRNALSALNGLTMNDIVNTGPSTALGTLKRDGDQVKASGYSQVVHLDAVRVNDPALASLLQTVTGQDFSNQALATVEGIQANADVALDGKSKGVEAANGTLARVVVLGHAIDTNSVLSPGTSCTVSIPGRSTCGGSLSAINIPDVTGGAVGSLLTVTLTRGIYSPSANNSPTFGEAKIVTLEVTANLNLPALEKLAATVPAAAQVLGLVTGHASVAGLATVGLGDGSQPLLDAQFGVASASVSLNTSQSAINPPGQPAVPPPNTGNDVLPLALLALALLAGGIGMSVRKGRFQRG